MSFFRFMITITIISDYTQNKPQVYSGQCIGSISCSWNFLFLNLISSDILSVNICHFSDNKCSEFARNSFLTQIFKATLVYVTF